MQPKIQVGKHPPWIGLDPADQAVTLTGQALQWTP